MNRPMLAPATVIILAFLSGLAKPAAGWQRCDSVVVLAEVELSRIEFTLADMLTPDICPELREAASQVKMGRTPLLGSDRILDGAMVRERLTDLDQNATLTVPPRIILRRAAPRASCADLVAKILPSLRAQTPATMREADCGSTRRIPRDAALEVLRTRWDAALESWDISVGCVHAADCVPFLVRVRGTAPTSGQAASPLDAETPTANADPLLVHPGETATLSWDEAGIRLLVPVVCLDAGRRGQKVRVRIAGGQRKLPAIVISQDLLQAEL